VYLLAVYLLADGSASCTRVALVAAAAAAAAAAAVLLQAGGQKYSPSQIGAFVLTKMKETAGEREEGLASRLELMQNGSREGVKGKAYMAQAVSVGRNQMLSGCLAVPAALRGINRLC
jgi:hypothetical protein